MLVLHKSYSRRNNQNNSPDDFRNRLIGQTLSSIGPCNNKYVAFLIGKINNGAGLSRKRGKAKFGFNFLFNIVKCRNRRVVVTSTYTFPYVFRVPGYGWLVFPSCEGKSNCVASNSWMLSTSGKSWESIKSSKFESDNSSNKSSALRLFTRGDERMMSWS